nr:unnamed protein product [Haemonchus contortus]
MKSPGKRGSSKGGSPVEKRSKGSSGSAGSNRPSRNSSDSPGSAERDKPSKNSPGSPGQKYGVDGDIIEKRNTESLKPSYFENLQNARPARAHVRNRKLKWKEGNSEEGSKTEEESSASSSSLATYLYIKHAKMTEKPDGRNEIRRKKSRSSSKDAKQLTSGGAGAKKKELSGAKYGDSLIYNDTQLFKQRSRSSTTAPSV